MIDSQNQTLLSKNACTKKSPIANDFFQSTTKPKDWEKPISPKTAAFSSLLINCQQINKKIPHQKINSQATTHLHSNETKAPPLRELQSPLSLSLSCSPWERADKLTTHLAREKVVGVLAGKGPRRKRGRGLGSSKRARH